MDKVQADFDRLALLSAEERWNHNRHYHGYLLQYVPEQCGNVLEIGCGTGGFARLLAERAEHVQALDLSPESIRIARERSRGFDNIEYQVADVLDYDLADCSFDCIVSIATLHHLPLPEILRKLKRALRPGGVLLVLDLYAGGEVADIVQGLVAVPVNLALQLAKTGRLQDPPEVRAAWAEHGKSDVYLRISEIRRICARTIAGARVRKHLLWRYSIVWRKARERSERAKSGRR